MVYETSDNIREELLNDSPDTELHDSLENINNAGKTKQGENKPSITAASALGDSKLSKKDPRISVLPLSYLTATPLVTNTKLSEP